MPELVLVSDAARTDRGRSSCAAGQGLHYGRSAAFSAARASTRSRQPLPRPLRCVPGGVPRYNYLGVRRAWVDMY